MPTGTNKKSIQQQLHTATQADVQWTTDPSGNDYGWLHLSHPESLKRVAIALHALQARLCTITAYSENRDTPENERSIAYHFILQKIALTVTIPIYDASGTALAVPSISPWFINADWPEREFIEMYDIKVQGHPNPKRLFLDERLDAGIMAKLIPFSAFANGAAGRTLWEQVMATKGIDISEQAKTTEPHAIPGLVDTEAALAKPDVTPVLSTQDCLLKDLETPVNKAETDTTDTPMVKKAEKQSDTPAKEPVEVSTASAQKPAKGAEGKTSTSAKKHKK